MQICGVVPFIFTRVMLKQKKSFWTKPEMEDQGDEESVHIRRLKLSEQGPRQAGCSVKPVCGSSLATVCPQLNGHFCISHPWVFMAVTIIH